MSNEIKPREDCQEGPGDLSAAPGDMKDMPALMVGELADALDDLEDMPALMDVLMDALDEAFDLRRSAWDTEERACSAIEPAHDSGAQEREEIARLDAELSELRSVLISSARRASGRG
jgi:hypothetical protein